MSKMYNRMVLVALVAMGCYTYAPVGDRTLDSGREVRAVLSPVQDLEVGTLTVRDVRSLDGTVLRADAQNLSVFSTWLHPLIGGRFQTNGEVFTLARGDLQEIGVRTLHPARTIVTLGIVAALGSGLLTIVVNPGGDSGTGTGNGPIETLLQSPLRPGR